MENSESLPRYFKEIRKFKTLESEEETALFKNIRQGDQTAKEQLIKANLRFVISIAKKYKKRGSVEDFINEGNIGLVHAIEKFDEGKGNRFLTYAGYWIEKYIREAFNESQRIIHLPVRKMELLKKIEKGKNVLYHRLEREPYIDEMAEFLGVTEEAVREVWDISNDLSSFDTLVETRDKKKMPLYEILPEDIYINGEDLLREDDESNKIKHLLSLLTKKQKKVIELYFGINSEGPINLEEIAIRLHISSEGARQLKDAGLKRLQNEMQFKRDSS